MTCGAPLACGGRSQTPTTSSPQGSCGAGPRVLRFPGVSPQTGSGNHPHSLTVVSLLLILSACGTEPSILPPDVQMFSAAPSTIASGDSALLIWSVHGADSVFLSPGVGAVTKPTRWVRPATSTTYRLVATNRVGAETAYAAVTVILPPLPLVETFAASAGPIVSGATSILMWSTIGADTVRIDQGIGPVRGNVLQVQPTSTTTYTLTAVNAGGVVNSSVVISVTPATSPPSDPAMFVARAVGGGGVLLSWSAVPLASSYSIEWSSNLSPTFEPLTTVNGSTFYVGGGPATANNLYTYRLTALNEAGASPGAVASTLAVPQPPEGPSPILIMPASTTVPRGGTVMFTASQMVTWIVLDGPGGGTITSAGVYTAPAGAGTFVVAAVSSVTNTAIVVVP